MEETGLSSQSGPKDDKYMEQFRKSRTQVKSFEEKFFAKHGRKPNKEDLAKAPEHVLTCIKNCRKIQVSTGQT